MAYYSSSGYMWTRRGSKRGKFLSKLNNGWIVLQMDDGTTKKYPPNLLSQTLILPPEAKKEPTDKIKVQKKETSKAQDSSTTVTSESIIGTTIVRPIVKANNMDDCIEFNFGFRVPRSWVTVNLVDEVRKKERLVESEKKLVELMGRLEKLEKRNEELELKLGRV